MQEAKIASIFVHCECCPVVTAWATGVCRSIEHAIAAFDHFSRRLGPVVTAGEMVQNTIARTVFVHSKGGSPAVGSAKNGRAIQHAVARLNQTSMPGLHPVTRNAAEVVNYGKPSSVFLQFENRTQLVAGSRSIECAIAGFYEWSNRSRGII